MPVWINYVEWMAKFVNIPVHTCLESMTYMIKNFSTGILVVLVVVVVLVVLELPPLLAPPSPPSVGLSNLVHMKLSYI